MAKFDRDKDLGDAASRILNESCTNLECAVCLQTCIHPAELPCGHIFCYLCIKGIVNQGRRCAMCRQDIPADYLEKPRLLKPVDGETSNQGFEDGHLWFYEGHNGWWQYDERTSLELESAYQKGERCCELLIAGFLYMADFDAMLQYRRNDPWKRRRIKRDLATTNKKGVAGLKAMQNFCSSPNIPQFVSNEPSDNPISAPSHTSVRNNLISLRSLSLSDSGPSHSGEENNETNRNGLRMRNRNLSASCSSFNHPVQTNTDSEIHLENLDSIPTRNFDLDRIIHDTLDWTIEQIESLNLELVNDYEILFRDVSNYDNLVNNTSRGRSDNAASYYRSGSVNYAHNSGFQSRSDSFNNSAESFSVLNSNENETPNETQNIPHSHFSSHNDAPFRNQLDESEQRIASQPPRMRVRGLRSRVTAPRRSASLSRKTLF